MSNDKKDNLKLIGRNEEDLNIISTYLQDSVVAVKDMLFLKKNRIFIMILNRFMWENVDKEVLKKNKRVKCAIKFEEVIKVQSKNINQKNKNKPLEYLAMECDSDNVGNKKISIFFSGNSAITIISEVVEVVMNDLGDSWHVKHIPKHKI